MRPLFRLSASPAAAINANGDASNPADSAAIVVGAPLAVTIDSLQASPGALTVTWSAPAINAELGASYFVVVARPGQEQPEWAGPLLTSPQQIGAAGTQPGALLTGGTKNVTITAFNNETRLYQAEGVPTTAEATLPALDGPGEPGVAAASVARPNHAGPDCVRARLGWNAPGGH